MLETYSVISSYNRRKNLYRFSDSFIPWTELNSGIWDEVVFWRIFILTYLLKSDPREEGAMVLNQHSDVIL